jgi:hypothetical protein
MPSEPNEEELRGELYFNNLYHRSKYNRRNLTQSIKTNN